MTLRFYGFTAKYKLWLASERKGLKTTVILLYDLMSELIIKHLLEWKEVKEKTAVYPLDEEGLPNYRQPIQLPR